MRIIVFITEAAPIKQMLTQISEHVISRKTPIWSARSMFSGRDSPVAPVK
ncbi:hypothetical protein [uncultured Thiohalocapsa sp.]|nr:hypothetical protein [uncultured Thiohalocapsa sp.]